MKVKKFNIEHEPTGGEITVEIDFGFSRQFGEKTETVNDFIKEMVTFWSGWESRVEENEGSLLLTFLKQLCKQSVFLEFEGNWNTDGVIEKFYTLEGWYPMDGSYGIKLLNVSGMEIWEQEDYSIHEIPYR